MTTPDSATLTPRSKWTAWKQRYGAASFITLMGASPFIYGAIWGSLAHVPCVFSGCVLAGGLIALLASWREGRP